MYKRQDEIAALQARVEAERRFKPEELVRAASEFWLNAQKGVETSLGGGLKGIGGSFTHLQQGVSDTFYKLERGLHGYSAHIRGGWVVRALSLRHAPSCRP